MNQRQRKFKHSIPKSVTTPANVADTNDGKGPALRFLLRFVLLMAFFGAISFTPLFQRWFNVYLENIARLAYAILKLIGTECSLSGTTIWSARHAITVASGCAALEFAAFYCSAVFAVPLPWHRKIPGVVVGICAIMILNIIRIVTLFLAGVYWPNAFEVIHMEIWPSIFIVATILIGIKWIHWALSKDRNAENITK